MTSFIQRILAAAAASSILLVASSASADMPPAEGLKRVPFTFTLHGVTSSDRVMFAYPCGTSNGAPQDEIKLLENAKSISVGRRGGACTIYSVEKTKYDDFMKTYVPDERNGTDAKLADFAGNAMKCVGAPSPVFEIAETDARSTIAEDLDVTAFDAGKCSVTSRNAPTSASTSGGNELMPTTDLGGCSIGGNARGAAPWLVALAVPFIVLGSRRRRKA